MLRFPSRKELQQVLTWHPSFPEGTMPPLQPRGNLPRGIDLLELMCGDAWGKAALSAALPNMNSGNTEKCSHTCSRATEPWRPVSPVRAYPPPRGSLERPGLRDETSFLPYWEVCIPGWAKRVCFGWSVNCYLFYSFILIHDRNRSGTVSEIEMLRCVTLFFGISFTKIMIESYIMSKLYKTSNGQYVRRPCKCIYIESNEPYLLTPFSGPLKLINNHHYWYYNEYT